MLAADSIFSPVRSVLRSPMSTLRTPFERKSSDVDLLMPLSSGPSSSTSAEPIVEAGRSYQPFRRRPKNLLVLARAQPKAAGASIVAALLLLAWLYQAPESVFRASQSSPGPSSSSAWTFRHAPPRLSSHVSHSLASTGNASLTHSQELAALTLFLTSEATHLLPDDLDPQQPLDPDLVLDMALSTDPSTRADDLRAMEAEAWETPVVLFGMRGDSATKLAHELLHGEDYSGENGAGVATVYIDRRSDTPVLIDLLARLTRRTSLTIILIGGAPLGGHEELLIQHNEGRLFGLIERHGCVLGRDAIIRRLKERQRELTGRQQHMRPGH